MAQYLDIAGVRTLWGKVKELAAASKTTVVKSSASGQFSGFTITTDNTASDGHTEYQFSLTDVPALSQLETIVSGYGFVKSSDVSELTTKVNTLIGSDSAKSVRTIANEELAAQLIPQSAQEALDTLQEIAAWIQGHPADVAAINLAITNLQAATALPASGEDPASGTIAAYAKGLVDAEATRATGEEARIELLITDTAAQGAGHSDGIDARLTAVETALGTNSGTGTISEQVAAAQEAIDNLDWTADAGEGNVLVGLNVVNGQLTADTGYTGGIKTMAIGAISAADLAAELV